MKFCCHYCFLQVFPVLLNHRFLVLKKKNKTIRRSTAVIIFPSPRKAAPHQRTSLTGLRKMPATSPISLPVHATTFGTYPSSIRWGSYRYKFNYNQIRGDRRKQKTNFNWRGSGASLMGGAPDYCYQGGIVYLADKTEVQFTPLACRRRLRHWVILWPKVKGAATGSSLQKNTSWYI